MSKILTPGQSSILTIGSATHICFNELVTAQTALSAMCFRMYPAPYLTKHTLRSVCYNFDFEVEIDASELLEPLSRHIFPDVLNLKFEPSPNGPSEGKNVDWSNPHIKLYSSFFYQAFLTFYEKCKLKINSKFGNITNAPDVIRFGNVVRNAFAHNGKVHISNPNSPAVSWGRLTYAAVNNGNPLLYHDLSNGDLVILMCEMDLELSL